MWISDPETKSVLVFLRGEDGNLHVREDYGQNDIAKVNSLDGCFIELEKVFS